MSPCLCRRGNHAARCGFCYSLWQKELQILETGSMTNSYSACPMSKLRICVPCSADTCTLLNVLKHRGLTPFSSPHQPVPSVKRLFPRSPGKLTGFSVDMIILSIEMAGCVAGCQCQARKISLYCWQNLSVLCDFQLPIASRRAFRNGQH